MDRPIPTPEQTALYLRLRRLHGDTPEWHVVAYHHDFALLSRHRAAHLLQRIIVELTAHHLIVPCGCAGRPSAALTPKHPTRGPDAGDGPTV